LEQNPFPEWFDEVAAYKITVDAANIYAEAQPNMWSFSISPGQAEIITVHDVKDFIIEVIKARSVQLQEHGFSSGEMVFYCWHDEQAGHLCFSMVSSNHGFLPFGAKLQKVEDLETIINSWLNSPYLHGIPWDDLEILEPGDPNIKDEEQTEEYILQVWSTLV